MSRASDIETKVELAIAARESGDFDTAITYLDSAMMLLAATPDVRHSNGDELRWDRKAIGAMLDQLNRRRSGAAGIRRIKVEYTETTD